MTSDERLLPLPLTYRAALIERVAATLRAGECCSIVGAGGVGKTNLARFLLRADVQAAYLGDRPTMAVLVDINALADGRSPEFALLELIIHRLIREAERRAMPDSLLASLDRLHATLLGQGDTVLALRYLERICGRLCDEHDLRLVLVFDQFDEIWRAFDARLFLNLRYLRDEFKYRLVFLTITRQPLRQLRLRARDDLAAVESFWEIFEPHVFGLGMYNEADARFQLERITCRLGRPLDEELARAAIAASGGHSQLLRALAWKLAAGAPMGDPEALLAFPEVDQECAKLWEDLGPDEQRVARLLATEMALDPADGEALAMLRLVELVYGEPPQLFAPLFAAYVRLRSGVAAGEPGVVVECRQRLVWVDGRLLSEQLTPLEFSLLAYLASRAGEVCRRDEILAAVYPDESLDVSDDRIDTLLRRLRESLGDQGRSPRHLITHRGVGVRLAQGHVVE
ncbi:MAG: hypothetical protein HGA45_10920 [Chloroflexales bacterium]|nr:hypothetical protein [Chloroflexales bacterium]